MGWFDEQIRQRKKIDNELFKESYINISQRVLGERIKTENQRKSIRSSIDDILNYYNFPRVEIPHGITDPIEQVDYAMGTVGMMKANIKLGKHWYADSLGPIICFFKEDNSPITLFPGGFGKFFYYDPETGKKVVVNKKKAALFNEDAIAFYEPLPLKELGIADLLVYMKKKLTYQDYIFYILIAFLLVLVSLLLPRVSQILTGTVLRNKDYSLFVAMSISTITLILFIGILGAISTAASKRVSWKITIPVQQAVMQRLLTLPVSFFRKYSAGELSNRATSIESICTIIVEDVFTMGISSLFSLMFVTQISKYAPSLVTPAVVVIFATVIFMMITTIMQMGVAKKRMKLLAKESGMTYAIINGIQKIKLAGAEKRVFAKWANTYAESAALAYNPPFFLKISGVINTAISLVGTIVIYSLAVKTGVSSSEYYAFNIAYAAMFAAFCNLSSVSMSIARIKPILDMAEPILKTKPEKTLKKDIATKINGSIEMGGVYFRYSESTPYILENFSLKIRAGEYVAIVGKTGCGKSTLVRLMLGFEKPEKGVVFFDGKDIERIDLKSLRRKIGSVIQDGKLFYGDIFHNISIASEKLTEEQAWEAAEMAGIADDIRAMPMGMNTIIAEGQGGISGGQKQRLLIARAVAPKPKVLIFDEATSALDNITQKQIAQSLDSLKCTRIVIAHRLSTIKNCDRILVIDGGKIVEQGTYDALIEKNGVFKELVARQQL